LLAVAYFGRLSLAQVDESGDVEEQLRMRLRTMDHVPQRLADRYLDRVARLTPPPPRPPYLLGTPYSGYHALFPYLGVEGLKVDEPDRAEPAPLIEQQAALAVKLRDDARRAFRAGEYQEAAKLAARSDLIDHHNAETHELLSLAMFALRDYRGAAAEAHAVTFFGRPSDWPALLNHYGPENYRLYEAQLRALEQEVRSHPDSPHAVFLLGYHYLMQGHADQARETLLEAIAITPQDVLAKGLLPRLESPPAAIEGAPAPPQPAR
jgi:tetratricopeptide (TPR) repeat protein